MTSPLTFHLYLALDASGFPLGSASTSYLDRLEERIEERCVLNSLDLVGAPMDLAVATQALPGVRQGAPRLVPPVRRVRREIAELYGDKGFDSEAMHAYLLRRGATGDIPTRGPGRPLSPLRRRL